MDREMTDGMDMVDAPEPEPAPFRPSEEWIDAFKKQCTDAMRLDLRAYAGRRARGVGRAGAHVDDSYADDLVADALADTLFGEVTWDPNAKTLYQHGEDTIRYRTRHDRHRARRFKHNRIDAPTCAAEQRATRGSIEASLMLDHSGETAESAIFATEVLTKVRDLAASDPSILRYLDAIVAGAQTRAEIMEVTKMSLKMFRNTRDRLGRLVEQLDQQVVESARQPRGARA